MRDRGGVERSVRLECAVRGVSFDVICFVRCFVPFDSAADDSALCSCEVIGI